MLGIKELSRFSSGVDFELGERAIQFAHPSYVMQIDARANVIWNYVHAIADLWPLCTFARVDFTMLFGQTDDFRLGIFNNVS
jgi:hypothetical protein